MAGMIPGHFYLNCFMRWIILLIFLLLQKDSVAQVISLKVGGQDFCSFPFKAGKKYPLIAKNMPKDGAISVTSADVKKVNDTLFIVHFQNYSPIKQVVEVFVGNSLYQSCTFRMPEREHFSITFDSFRSGDSIRVTDLSTLPVLKVVSDTATCVVVSYSVSAWRKRGDYPGDMKNTGARLQPAIYQRISNLSPNWRIMLDHIQVKCGGDIYSLGGESFFLFMK